MLTTQLASLGWEQIDSMLPSWKDTVVENFSKALESILKWKNKSFFFFFLTILVFTYPFRRPILIVESQIALENVKL